MGSEGLFAHGLGIAEILRRIPSDTDAIGVSTMFSVGWPHDEALCHAIGAAFPRAPVIIGGEHATAMWHYVLEHCPSVAVCATGVGEETVVELADWVEGRRSLDRIRGIAYRANGKPTLSERRNRLRELELIPRPAWHLFPMESYFRNGIAAGIDLGRSMPMIATRGCPYQCTFCSSPDMRTTRYAMRRAQDVVNEMADYATEFGAQNIDFQDLTLVVKRDWILEFCRELEGRALKLTYQLPTGTRSEALDEEVLRALSRTGCRHIAYAPESGSDRVLRRMKKSVRLDRLVDSIQTAVRLGFGVRVNLILGYPDESRWDLLRTILFGLRLSWLGVEDVLVFGSSPYPGSGIYDELRASGRIGPPDNGFFASLDTMNIAWIPSYCSATGVELSLYRWAMMGACALIGLARHPARIIRMLRNIRLRQSESNLEKNILRILPRQRRSADERAGA